MAENDNRVNHYTDLLWELANKKRETLEIKNDQFMEFQAALSEFPKKKSIIGEATRGGDATYHFDHESS